MMHFDLFAGMSDHTLQFLKLVDLEVCAYVFMSVIYPFLRLFEATPEERARRAQLATAVDLNNIRRKGYVFGEEY